MVTDSRPDRAVLATATGHRLAYLDTVKTALVAGVIFGHAWAGYSTVAEWAYTDAREVTLRPATETVMEILLGPFAIFAMGMFFFIAGLLTPASLSAKGPLRFARDRMLRLGVPLVAFTLIIWPPVSQLMERLAGRSTGPLWSGYLRALRSPDPSYLWFVEELLLFCVGYALWRRLRRVDRPGLAVTRLTPVQLTGVAIAIAGGSFTMRLWFPLDSTQYAGLHLAQLPQHLALFSLGAAGGRRGWFAPVPNALRRTSGWTALLSTLAIGGFAVVVALSGVPATAFYGGVSLASLATATVEGLLAVNLSVWLLGLVQRHLGERRAPPHAARGAYAAYLAQGPVLVGLALLLRPIALPAELKAVAVSLLGVLVSFELGWILVGRTRLRRIL